MNLHTSLVAMVIVVDTCRGGIVCIAAEAEIDHPCSGGRVAV